VGRNSLGPHLTATPLLLAGGLLAFAFDSPGNHVYFVESGQPLLARLDLGSLAYVQAKLDGPPLSMGLVGGSPGAVFASGQATFGRVITFPTSAFDAATSSVDPASGEA